MSRRYALVATLSLLAALVGGLAPWAFGALADTTAKDRIEAAPPPALFPDADVRSTRHDVSAVQTRAQRLMADWWSGHDARPHDAEFEQFLEQALPGPPSPAQRDREVKAVQHLAPQRTPAGVTAATWLEEFGKKDVWKLYAHDQAEMLAVSRGDEVKNDVDDLLAMAKTVADTLGTRYHQSAPYVLHPSLRTDHVVTPGQVCPCSYPSRHATAGAAARTFLGSLAPHREADYRWMEAEVDYSRVYMAGHVASDITGGALLGDMIGEYFSRTRG
jgi:hypothetical protein